MSGMRDKLIHDYFGVDVEVVWKSVKEDIPYLKSLAAAIPIARLAVDKIPSFAPNTAARSQLLRCT